MNYENSHFFFSFPFFFLYIKTYKSLLIYRELHIYKKNRFTTIEIVRIWSSRKVLQVKPGQWRDFGANLPDGRMFFWLSIVFELLSDF